MLLTLIAVCMYLVSFTHAFDSNSTDPLNSIVLSIDSSDSNESRSSDLYDASGDTKPKLRRTNRLTLARRSGSNSSRLEFDTLTTKRRRPIFFPGIPIISDSEDDQESTPKRQRIRILHRHRSTKTNQTSIQSNRYSRDE